MICGKCQKEVMEIREFALTERYKRLVPGFRFGYMEYRTIECTNRFVFKLCAECKAEFMKFFVRKEK